MTYDAQRALATAVNAAGFAEDPQDGSDRAAALLARLPEGSAIVTQDHLADFLMKPEAQNHVDGSITDAKGLAAAIVTAARELGS